jgi:hypothetical protein
VTTLDPISGTRWTIQPVPFGMAVLVLAIGVHLLYTVPALPLVSALVAFGGAAVSGITVWMLTLGWATDNRVWTRRGYFYAGSVFLGRGVALILTDGALIDIAFMLGLCVMAVLCCRAEVEAAWERSRAK